MWRLLRARAALSSASARRTPGRRRASEAERDDACENTHTHTRMARRAPAMPGLGGAGAAPPLPAGLPPDAAKHAAALWSFLDELAEDPKARLFLHTHRARVLTETRR